MVKVDEEVDRGNRDDARKLERGRERVLYNARHALTEKRNVNGSRNCFGTEAVNTARDALFAVWCSLFIYLFIYFACFDSGDEMSTTERGAPFHDGKLPFKGTFDIRWELRHVIAHSSLE